MIKDKKFEKVMLVLGIGMLVFSLIYYFDGNLQYGDYVSYTGLFCLVSAGLLQNRRLIDELRTLHK